MDFRLRNRLPFLGLGEGPPPSLRTSLRGPGRRGRGSILSRRSASRAREDKSAPRSFHLQVGVELVPQLQPFVVEQLQQFRDKFGKPPPISREDLEFSWNESSERGAKRMLLERPCFEAIAPLTAGAS